MNQQKNPIYVHESAKTPINTYESAYRSTKCTIQYKYTFSVHALIEFYIINLNCIKPLGEDNIETIVEDFIKNEDENFALFNYVNELNSEVETLQEEVLAIRKDIAAYKLEDKEEDDKRHSLMKQLEVILLCYPS